MELPIEVVAVPDGDASLVFEFKNEVAPAVQDLNVVAFEGRVGKRYDIVDAVAVGCEYVWHPDVGVRDVNSDEGGVNAAEVVGNDKLYLLGAALRESDTLRRTLKIKIAAVWEYPGPGSNRIEARAGIC